MEKRTVEGAADAGMNLAHLKHEVAKAKTLMNDLVEDGKRNAQRMVKRGYNAAEDYVEDTTYYIKRHPWPAVGMAAGIGAGAGLLAGWLCTRAWVMNGTSRHQAMEH
jgi:ElaB/YqjD/DUF883 family membrane-anchored ribosome-binding protein